MVASLVILSGCFTTGQNVCHWLLDWCVMTGRHKTIEYLMQVPSHTHWWIVDLPHSKSSTGIQLEEEVNRSASINVAVCYPTWLWCDCKSFLEHVVRPVPGIWYEILKGTSLAFSYSSTEVLTVSKKLRVQNISLASFIMFVDNGRKSEKKCKSISGRTIFRLIN